EKRHGESLSGGGIARFAWGAVRVTCCGVAWMGCGPSVCLHRGGASAAQTLEQPLDSIESIAINKPECFGYSINQNFY
ncbi:hypothetical protein, partial [Acidovorax sp. HMWF018]|uniref:hypothetical protein n=1 Tax=Acidovorax sp. HMWF018 TaxID=2056855 RepID=UPI001E4A106A